MDNHSGARYASRRAGCTTVVVAALCLWAIGPTIQAQDELPVRELADLRTLADAGEAGAQFTLGQMYFAGNHHAEAVAWYHKAAEQGHVEAQHKLGRMYHDGRGVPQDFAEAIAWYHKAAEQGQPQALWHLGDMHREGSGVPRDAVEAHRWYNLAASRLTGDQREEAATARDWVAKWMTTEELNEAQRRAREWHAAHPVQMRSGVLDKLWARPFSVAAFSTPVQMRSGGVPDELAAADGVGGTAYRLDGGVYRPGGDVTTPRLLYDVPPRYTTEAKRAGIQGTVWLEVVVLPDGTVGDVEVTKSLDRVYGLDDQAIAAARNWRFAPGTRFGEPVAVLVGLELFFNLR